MSSLKEGLRSDEKSRMPCAQKHEDGRRKVKGGGPVLTVGHPSNSHALPSFLPGSATTHLHLLNRIRHSEAFHPQTDRGLLSLALGACRSLLQDPSRGELRPFRPPFPSSLLLCFPSLTFFRFTPALSPQRTSRELGSEPVAAKEVVEAAGGVVEEDLEEEEEGRGSKT